MGVFKESMNTLIKIQEALPTFEKFVDNMPTSDLAFYQREIEALRSDLKFWQKQVNDNKAEALFWRQKALEFMSKEAK